MRTYLFHLGDGNEGNFPCRPVNLTDDDCPFAALRALVINTYHLGPVRDYIAANIQTDGEREYGVHATVYEGPDGETAFGAAWITAELQPMGDDPDAGTLADVLDEAAMADYTARIMDLNAMTAGYLECALWASTDEEGNPLDGADFHPDALASARGECADFVRQCEEAGIPLTQESAQIGHDLWLTRNHHGVGFWDRGLGPVGERLSEIARLMGSVDAYAGDDGKIHFQ